MPIFMLFSPIITPRYLVENGTSKEAAIVQTFTKEDTVVLVQQGAAWVGADQEVEDDEAAGGEDGQQPELLPYPHHQHLSHRTTLIT